ncbi:MAG: hypothetical protein HQL77_13845 [Magnetococcales bacterium]|nr:hypothetical protein [Magnetococcales bacterium]MBF0436443.1 hypothetical protein [Magnetococcales bacterium]
MTVGLTKGNAISLIGSRFGNRSDLDTIIEDELNLAQTQALEGGDFLPWFLIREVKTTVLAGTSRISMDALGSSDLTTNGTFSSDSSWTKGTGWTISGGKATSDGSQSTNADLSQDITVTQNDYYTVRYTLSGVSAGTIVAKVAGTSGTARSKSGNYEERIMAGAGTSPRLAFSANADFIGSIDNVMVWGEGDAKLLRVYEHGGVYYGAAGATLPVSEMLRGTYKYLWSKLNTESPASPTHYAIRGRDLIFYPVPVADFELFSVGYHRETPFDALATGDSNAWLQQAADWFVAEASFRVAYHLKDNESLQKFQQEAASAKARVMMAHRANAHPTEMLIMGGAS